MEVHDGLKAAGFTVCTSIASRSFHTAHRDGGSSARDYFKIEVKGIYLKSDSDEWARFLEVCDILKVGWTIDSGRSVTVEQKREEWKPEYDAMKEAEKRGQGHCAECDEKVWKTANSALCDSCLQEEEYTKWKQERTA